MLRPEASPSRFLALMLCMMGKLLHALVGMAIMLAGCRHDRRCDVMPYGDSAMGVALTKVEYPDLEVPSRDTTFPIEGPRTLRDLSGVQYWDLSLEETVRLALL